MSELNPTDFDAFFTQLWGYRPFPWQQRLAERVCGSGWPSCLDLPTASGKTACLDVAVFAMAVKQRGPRRVFFVVDRRVVVDAAFDRMQKIACKLHEAEEGVLKTVGDRLRGLAHSGCPLDTYELRGGIYRDDSWVRSPLQPTLVASTVDQVGSRLLFRGYGVWDKVLPIHAGLVTNDSLILLDEAHCSRPFSETLAAVQRYRGPDWGPCNPDAPFAFVEMTATPVRESGEHFGLQTDDFANSEMRKRLFAPKPSRLVVSKARAKDLGKLAESLVEEAVKLAAKPGIRRIAVMVNRVRTARLAREALETRGFEEVHLLIGRMRPVDRESLPEPVQAMLSGKPRTPGGKPVFVVATQCLEVGADLDFDAIVTECASIDALLQRFGRLDRIGDLRGSGITAEGRVVVADTKSYDPVYGDALAKTWNWLKDSGEDPDFAICSEAGDATVRERLNAAGEGAKGLRRDVPLWPSLLPAHLDVLVQTSPRPALEPDISLYLHGVEAGSPEVQVLWRADLYVANSEAWADIVALCPPVAAEAMAVPLRDFRAWLTNTADEGAASSDVEGADREDEAEGKGELRCKVLRWRGDDSKLIDDANRIRPGDTLVLAAATGGWDELGHIPPGAEIDVAERARQALHRGWVLRLHPALMERWPEHAARQRLMGLARQPDLDVDQVKDALDDYQEAAPEWLKAMLKDQRKRIEPDRYPDESGWILTEQFAEADAGGDEISSATAVFLDQHLKDVTRVVKETAEALVTDEQIRQSLVRAAQLHDCGKADERFQALLRGGDPMAAQFAPRLLAKGAAARQSKPVRQAQWKRSGLPDGFRHELISLLLARQEPELAERDLLLHLIASHHGRCRPFAPVVEDIGGGLAYNGNGITQAQRTQLAAHRLESGVAERFWRLTRQYGWWGLAYLESILRLGDWKASKEEAEKENRP
jgi:CRISPR-associated endonuclease/helicase Cas3